jgi:penicillin-binding protein 1A
MLLGAVLALIGFITLAVWIYIESRNLPEVFSYEDYKDRAVQMSEVVAEDGAHLHYFFDERRIVVPREEIPDVMKIAMVAAEDADFYSHGGIDFWGIFRSMIKNVLRRRFAQGASTITQQVARTFYLSQRKTLKRKLREMILSQKLERKLSKDEILSMYLNQIYFGHGRYGVEAASRYYFGRSVKDLGLAEAALLAGLVQSPERLSPYKHPKRAKARRAYVLKQLVSKDFVDEKRGLAAQSAPLGVLPRRPQSPPEAAYFVDAVRRRLEATLGISILMHGPSTAVWEGLSEDDQERLSHTFGSRARSGGLSLDEILAIRQEERAPLIRALSRATLRRGGVVVQTTMSVEAQQQAVRAVEDGLARFDVGQKVWRPERNFKSDVAAKRYLQRWGKKNPGKERTGRIVPVVVQRVAADGSWSVETPYGPRTMRLGAAKERHSRAVAFAARAGKKGKKKTPGQLAFKKGDLLRAAYVTRSSGAKSAAIYEPELGAQAAMVVIESDTRAVVALVGGDNARRHPFNRAVQSSRQAGSSFKPILYAMAVDQGIINEQSIFYNTPETYRLPSGKRWTPSNYNGKHDGKALSLADAVAGSVNVVAVQVLSRLSPKELIQIARRLGISGHMEPNLTLALGSAEVTPLELTNAIATFPAMGRFEESVLIRNVRLPNGENVDVAAIWRQLRCRTQPMLSCTGAEDVFQLHTARTVIRVMKQVVQRGTGRKIRALKRPAAGKTGTTNQGRTLWFMGFTPDYTAGVMVANDDRRPIRKGTGGRFAAPIWLDFMKEFLRGRAVRDFGEWARVPPPTAADLSTGGVVLPSGAEVREVEVLPPGSPSPKPEGGSGPREPDRIAPPPDLDLEE